MEKTHQNIIFIGHVDSGKSTLAGQILLKFSYIDERIIEKYKEIAKENKRETWYLAYVMDNSEEEREKGKTIQVGYGSFQTDKKRYTLLDAPGHKLYVPNMVEGTAQADIAILLISAKKGEYESGMNGQTKEHILLAYAFGIKRLIVVINKMDDESINWNEELYNNIKNDISKYIKKYKFKTIKFIPISAYKNINVVTYDETISWYKEKSLIDTLDDLDVDKFDVDIGLRIPIVGKNNSDENKFLILSGKIESGSISINDNLIIMPSNIKIKINKLLIHDVSVDKALKGENITLHIKCDDDVKIGDVICNTENAINYTKKIMVELYYLQTNILLTAGCTFMIHLHSYSGSVTVDKLISRKI